MYLVYNIDQIYQLFNKFKSELYFIKKMREKEYILKKKVKYIFGPYRIVVFSV
jgi:hypothetical protein